MRRPLVQALGGGPDSPAVCGLVAGWRARAADLREWAAAEQAAVAWEHAAQELEERLRAEGEELLNLTQAAGLCGYSADHLGREVRAGRISNAGRSNAPRIRRSDLPRKPGALLYTDTGANVVGVRGRIARAVVHSEPGV